MTLTDDPLQQFQFFVVKGINRLKKEEPAAARPSNEVELLTEIRESAPKSDGALLAR